MSYARSPRALCSTTIGTECPMCASVDLAGGGFGCGDALGLLDQPVDGLGPDDSVDQRSDVAAQGLDDRLARLAVLGGERVELALDVGLGRLDAFLLRDGLDQQGGLHPPPGLLAELLAQVGLALAAARDVVVPAQAG